MKGPWMRRLCGCLAVCALVACGQEGDAKASRAPSPEAAASAPENASETLDPCGLLTDEEVSTVLPGHDGGFVANAGGSLVEGIDTYQCSYTNEQTDLLTVVLSVAVDEERFDSLKPSSLTTGQAREIDVGDGGWVRGEPDDMKVTVLKGLARIDLELMAPDAGQRTEALVDVASAVAGKAR